MSDRKQWQRALHRAARALGGRRAVLLALAGACLAPTPGDIGGCGQPVEDLDARAFFRAKAQVDCDACGECGLKSDACAVACSGGTGEEQFEEGCYPLLHDGEVCLRALRHGSCEDYASYVADVAPTTPTECDFCPAKERP